MPLRTCAGCGGKFAKASLVRFTVFGEVSGRIVGIDPGSGGKDRSGGRGAYICPNPVCFGKAMKKNALTRRLRAAAVSPGLKQDFEHVLRLRNNHDKKESL